MHHINPQAVRFDDEDIYHITRNRMARWMGVTLTEWDAMTYKDQCIAIEIRRAENENTQFDIATRGRS